MTSRRTVLVGAGSLVVAGLAGAGTVMALSDDQPAAAPAREARNATAEVTRTDLVATDTFDAELGYREPSELTFAKPGTITALAAAETVVERGGTLGEVDGRPIVLLFGDRPLWRTLTADPVGPDGQPVDQLTGPDVRVLEQNLVALGFIDHQSDAKVDDLFTGSTAEAVKAWQKFLGVQATGVIEATDVVVREAAVRVVARTAQTGANSGGPVLSVSPTDMVVSFDLRAARQSLVPVGRAVSVVLPDGRSMPAKVAKVEPGEAADPEQPTDTVKVEVVLDDPSAVGSQVASPAEVVITSNVAEDVMAVPVAALLALSEGGYAVERVDGDSTKLVGVETGEFASGLVEVRPSAQGTLAEGDRVVVPS